MKKILLLSFLLLLLSACDSQVADNKVDGSQIENEQNKPTSNNKVAEELDKNENKDSINANDLEFKNDTATNKSLENWQSYESKTFGIKFKYKMSDYKAPIEYEAQVMENKTELQIYLEDNARPEIEGTAKAFIRINRLYNQDESYIETYGNNLGCDLIKDNFIPKTKSRWVQCAGMGDSHNVLIKHPYSNFILFFDAPFADNGSGKLRSFDDTVESIEFFEPDNLDKKEDENITSNSNNLDLVSIETAEIKFDKIKVNEYNQRRNYFVCSKLYWKNTEVDILCDISESISPYNILQDRYLIYRSSWLRNRFLDLFTGQIFKINTLMLSDYGITPNHEYLYFCADPAMLSGGFDVFKLSPANSPKRPDWVEENLSFSGCGGYNEEKKAYMSLDLLCDGTSCSGNNLEYIDFDTGKRTKDPLNNKITIDDNYPQSTKLNIKNIIPTKELRDRTLIEAYYFALYPKGEGYGYDFNQEFAYNLKGNNSVSFETFQEWYKDIYFAKIKDFNIIGDSKYSFIVELHEYNQENRNSKTNNYKVEMEVRNNKLFTISSIEQ